MFSDAGFKNVKTRPMAFGMVAITSGELAGAKQKVFAYILGGSAPFGKTCWRGKFFVAILLRTARFARFFVKKIKTSLFNTKNFYSTFFSGFAKVLSE